MQHLPALISRLLHSLWRMARAPGCWLQCCCAGLEGKLVGVNEPLCSVITVLLTCAFIDKAACLCNARFSSSGCENLDEQYSAVKSAKCKQEPEHALHMYTSIFLE